MSIEENKILVRRYFEEAPHNPDVCDEIFASSFLFHTIQHASITQQTTESNPQSEKAAYAWLALVWSPSWRMTVDEMIAEGDRVMVRWTLFVNRDIFRRFTQHATRNHHLSSSP